MTVADGKGTAEVQQLRKMLTRLEAQLVEQIKINAELEEALKASELRALQAQINPHFLFNTLSTISAQALLEGAERTHQLVTALARLLRYSLRRISQMVTVGEELEHVGYYLLIQRARFGEGIRTVIEVEEEARGVKIPLLTLQPLVENAIIHGLKSCERGTVTIRGWVEGDRVALQVADDGVGMDEETLQKLRRLDETGSGKSHTTGLGIANVQRRLQYHFGEKFGLTVRSRPGHGTTVTAYIPRRSKEVGNEGSGG